MDPRNFLMTSDYPMTAFVAKWEGSITLGAYDYRDTEFDHNLPFLPLLVGQWSLNANFEPAYDISTTNGYFVGVSFNQAIGSTNSKIKINLTNGYDHDQTFYYRVFAFIPSDFDGETPAIEDSTNFRLDLDNNYQKIYKQGQATIPNGGYLIVPHNLGYVPLVRTWAYDSINDFVSPFVNLKYEDSSYDSYTKIDEQNLTIVGTAGDTRYYHIYTEEA